MALTHDRRGIYKKHIISRTDGRKIDENATFFAIRVDGKDPYASKALIAYANAIAENPDQKFQNLANALWPLIRYNSWEGFENFGLATVYSVSGKVDGTPLDLYASYYVFRIDEDPYSVYALREYASHCSVINPVLASDLGKLSEKRSWTFIDVDFFSPEDIFGK